MSVQNDNLRKFLSVPSSSGELINYFVGYDSFVHFSPNLQGADERSQLGSDFSRLPLVDSYHSRRISLFHLKNRRTFTLFTSGATAHDTVHDAFMTLPAYTRIRKGEVQELGCGVRNGSSTARSRPVEASRERMERACPGTSAQGTAGSRIPWELQTQSGGFYRACHRQKGDFSGGRRIA